MSNPLQQRIARYFAEGQRTSLMAQLIEQWSDEEILQALELPHRAVRKLAYDRLLEWLPQQDITGLILKGLNGSAEMQVGVLLALSALPVEKEDRIAAAVLQLLDHEEHSVRTAAARVIAFRFPNEAARLLSLAGKPGFAEVLRHLCYSGLTNLIPEMATAVGFPNRRLPPAMGVLVDQFWLAENFETHPGLVSHLAGAHGFANFSISDKVIDLWRDGCSCVTDEMLQQSMAGWKERVMEFRWQLFPDSYQIRSSEPVAVLTDDPLDRVLFLAAVRDSDREQLQLIRTRHPFSIHFQPAAANAICCHAKLSFAEELFIHRAQRVAKELNIPAELHGAFWLDHARTQLILDSDERAENEAVLRAKWQVQVQNEGFSTEVSFPVEKDGDFPDAKWLVLPSQFERLQDQRLSAGSLAIANLAQAAGCNESADWLVEQESRWREFLTPIGMELQVPLMDVNKVIAWKQALRFLGVPSPRRPEYHKMTEAAFLPVPTFHAAVLGPLLLCRLGMIAKPQDMAMHLSFQGDLGAAVRYLAFPQLFIHPSQRSRKRAAWTITPLMSKGLVHLNRDVVDCDPDRPADCRTEIRIFRCIAEEIETGIQLKESYVDDVIANHILASAVLSDNQETEARLQKYYEHIEAFAKQLGPVFIELLHANYYEATGNPEDVAMLDYLPIVRKRAAVKCELTDAAMAAQIEEELLTMRTSCVRDLVSIWWGPKSENCGLNFSVRNYGVRLQ